MCRFLRTRLASVPHQSQTYGCYLNHSSATYALLRVFLSCETRPIAFSLALRPCLHHGKHSSLRTTAVCSAAIFTKPFSLQISRNTQKSPKNPISSHNWCVWYYYTSALFLGGEGVGWSYYGYRLLERDFMFAHRDKPLRNEQSGTEDTRKNMVLCSVAFSP